MISPERLDTPRLHLEPLRVEHADELAPLFDDPVLHRFIGGRPETVTELRRRYARQVKGQSADGSERWFNWVVRLRTDGRAVGTVQATISEPAGRLTADLAWVIATPHQGQGYAREAAAGTVAWLRRQSVTRLRANVHPDHGVSQAVARAIGLRPTRAVVGGELRWEAEG